MEKQDINLNSKLTQEKRFVWNGMPLDDARLFKQDVFSIHPLIRAVLTLSAMFGIRLDLYRHKLYIIPAILIFIINQTYMKWFLDMNTFNDETKTKIVVIQAIIFPFIYYFYLCTFPVWTYYLKKSIGDRLTVIIFNLGIGSLWMFLIILFPLLRTYDPLMYNFTTDCIFLIKIIGILMCIVGGIIKFWASYILGVASYYYADMIHRQSLEGSSFNIIGPYKWFKNPMYGIGYINTYGYGLMYNSPLCIVLAIVMHLGVWLFNIYIEQKWVKRIYDKSFIECSIECSIENNKNKKMV
jgi:protein-S-isoprenylcysteine O-methyltransferase Ste14